VKNDRRARFATAVVGQPFGIEGFARLTSLSGETEHIVRRSQLVVRGADGVERAHQVECFKPHGSSLLVKFKGIETPEDVKKLCGAELLVERADAAPLARDEFYIEDLKGVRAIDESGRVLGEIADLIEGGGGFLVEIILPSGETRLVPFRDEFIGAISLKERTAILLRDWILE
jgi:16S rRNA processing protein RimM